MLEMDFFHSNSKGAMHGSEDSHNAQKSAEEEEAAALEQNLFVLWILIRCFMLCDRPVTLPRGSCAGGGGCTGGEGGAAGGGGAQRGSNRPRDAAQSFLFAQQRKFQISPLQFN